eukprot:6186481-Pleurochrysis_carterae.AAC.2
MDVSKVAVGFSGLDTLPSGLLPPAAELLEHPYGPAHERKNALEGRQSRVVARPLFHLRASWPGVGKERKRGRERERKRRAEKPVAQSSVSALRKCPRQPST